MLQVKIEQGLLEGTIVEHPEGSYFAFKGIPYAKPPVGNLRFKAPEPPESWTGIREAKQHGPKCPQYNERLERIEEGSEDCLYINIYRKTSTLDTPLPVMVWIHGGAFYTGSGDSDFYGPEFFMSHDVILVTFNYRLEVLGFLCLDNEEVPGNAGLKDQVAALRWIKANIAAFGGDQNNITIFGCSAGAASTSLHLISQMSRGLFHKAICQSGVCLNEWSYTTTSVAKQIAFKLGQLLGNDTEDTGELLKFLRSVPSSLLVNIKLPVTLSNCMDITDSILFRPVIENSVLKVDKFLTETPPDLIERGQIANVPVIVGHTTGEGIEVVKNIPAVLEFFKLPGAVVPRELKEKWTMEKIDEVDMRIRSYYFGNKEICMETLQELVDLETDALFVYNIVRYARCLVKHNAKPVYMYQFTAETERNITKDQYKMQSVKGVCHSDELFYLFNVTCLNVPLTDTSKKIIKSLVKLWVTFAATGSPTLKSDSEQWQPFTIQEPNCLVIGDTNFVTQFKLDKIAFWEKIYNDK